jgi:integrase
MSRNSELIKFKVAQLCKGKEWYIYYYVINPSTEKLERKKIKLNFIKSIQERTKYANNLMRELNDKLYSGYNPFNEESNPRAYKILIDSIHVFLKTKEKELRSDSIRSYKSYISIFEEWLELKELRKIRCENFKKIHAVEFMEWVYLSRKCSALTYNNYRLFFVTLWNWLKGHNYIVSNPFSDIQKKTQTQKQRIIIDPLTRTQILEHLEVHDYNFLILALLVFHALIRPKEICMLKPENFMLQKQIIEIPASVAKNKTSRLATIPNILMNYLMKWDFNKAMNNEYIFGKDFAPGKVPIDPRRFTKKWDNLRKELQLDENMKLYSLRDSGIVQMLQDGISPEEVMRQADHSSLEITTIYVKFANPTGSEQIKSKSTKF